MLPHTVAHVSVLPAGSGLISAISRGFDFRPHVTARNPFDPRGFRYGRGSLPRPLELDQSFRSCFFISGGAKALAFPSFGRGRKKGFYRFDKK